MEKARIMIVEDEGIVAEAVQLNLQNLGYEVTSIELSGEEAIKRTDEEKPDLVLMDIMLGGEMNGVETADQMKSRFNIPVIYITAYADEEMLERAKITEPFGYIVKPIEDRDLHISIEMALYKHKMEMERERLISELKDALAHIKTLRGLLPMCAWCKKIRDDKGYWAQVEVYMEKHLDATFTHGICPECLKKVDEEEIEE
jgi:CheY-like chemotaxis protein